MSATNTAIHSAAVVMSFIGCTTWKRTIGLAATSTADMAPADGPPSARPARYASHTSMAPATGVTPKSADGPPSFTTGASNSEKPGAHTGAAAEGSDCDGTKPPGANVFGASPLLFY